MFEIENFRESIVVLVSTPLYLILVGIEMLLSAREKKHYYTVKDTLTNIYLMSVNFVLDILTRAFVFFLLTYFYQHQFFTISNPFIYWFLLFILEDFAFYWLHRIDHSTRLFWAIHVTHHSSRKFNLTTGFRSSVFQPLYKFVYFIPIALMGFHPLDILLMYSITQIYGIMMHTQLIRKSARWFESIMVTPSHHRVHHASNVPFLDKNMGMVLIIWDRMFGTFIREDAIEEKIVYGLTSNEEYKVPVEVITHEWRNLMNDLKQTKGFKNKMKLLFSPPGWTPEDDSHTAKVLQKEYWANEHKKSIHA